MNNKFYHLKLKAGALQYTIFISVVIALLVFAFIALTYVQQKLRIKNSHFQKVVHHVNQGFIHLATNDIPCNEQAYIEPITEANTKTTFFKTHWGVFDLVTTTSTRNNESFTKTALLGGHLQEKPGLYVQDNNQPLVLVGNTHIEGKVYLPEQGVKRGSIAGHSYMRNQLIYGEIVRSTNKLPELQQRQYIKTIVNKVLSKEDNVFIELQENSTLLNSFSKPTYIASSIESINLRFVELTGNIVIHSENNIKVYPSSRLNNVILIAPEIEVLGNTTGNFQGFATKKIKVGKNCKLTYPTALVLFEKEKVQSATTGNNTLEANQITIDKGADIRGIIAFMNDSKTGTYKPQVVLEENTTVMGELYCDQSIELKGTVKGSVYTRGFIANQFGSVYINHIYNGKILGNDLPQQYGGLSFKDSKPTVAKWLNY